jgi:hypothetical protein
VAYFGILTGILLAVLLVAMCYLRTAGFSTEIRPKYTPLALPLANLLVRIPVNLKQELCAFSDVSYFI